MRAWVDAACQTMAAEEVDPKQHVPAYGVFFNQNTFQEWVRLVREAKESIKILMYAFTSTRMAVELIRRRKEGLSVHAD